MSYCYVGRKCCYGGTDIIGCLLENKLNRLSDPTIRDVIRKEFNFEGKSLGFDKDVLFNKRIKKAADAEYAAQFLQRKFSK